MAMLIERRIVTAEKIAQSAFFATLLEKKFEDGIVVVCRFYSLFEIANSSLLLRENESVLFLT